MNQIVYNASMLAGTAAASAGAALQWGPGVALMVGGALVIVLALLGAFVARWN